MLFEEIGEKEQLQYEEYDEKLDENDGPKRLAPRHIAEPVGIQVVCPIPKARLLHRLQNVVCFGNR
jgi:hypothetical protein